MAKQQLFTIETLHLLDDGALAEDFNKQLTALVQDCVGRPGITKTRTLKLEVKVEPIATVKGECEDVRITCVTSSKAPNRPITSYRMAATKNGGLKFAPDSPESPDQKSLGFDE